MKLAVPYDNGNVFQHFGKTENFKVYEIENGVVVSSQIISSNGQGHSALAGVLKDLGVRALLCGGIGEGARSALSEAQIDVLAGAEGNADAAVESYLNGTFRASEASCDHHHDSEEGCGHHEEGQCGSESHCGSGGQCGGCCGSRTPSVTGKNAGKKCTVHYKGTFNDGSQFDSSYDRGQPLEFVCGAGMMIHGFDAAVANMEVGETVTVHLMPEEAYGMPNPAAVMVVQIAELPGSEDLNIGERVVLADETGRRFPVHVTAKDETTITLDANHEMAGKELNFLIELVSVD